MSSGNDVEDELALELEEPVANPGTTIGTKIFCFAQICLATCGSAVVFDHWSTH